MAATMRQPFAPLDETRLQALTSLKNTQNALLLSPSIGAKRKAADPIDSSLDFENVDPCLFSKRSKGSHGTTTGTTIVADQAAYPCLSFTPIVKNPASAASSVPMKHPASLPRPKIEPRSPATKLSMPISQLRASIAPAGRSPPRSKRSGLLTQKRGLASLYRRVDPPSLLLGKGSASFSLDTALKGTVSSSRLRHNVTVASAKALAVVALGHSMSFEIHEDTPEQEMTNLLQHSTCVLDISSDEESEQKVLRDQAEGRNKENIPPADDTSQTSLRLTTKECHVDVLAAVSDHRVALAEMSPESFYGDGCHETSVFIVPGDEEGDGSDSPYQVQVQAQVQIQGSAQSAEPATDSFDSFDFAPQLNLPSSEELLAAVETDRSSKAAVLQPIEGTGESFELWESGSAKDGDDDVAGITDVANVAVVVAFNAELLPAP